MTFFAAGVFDRRLRVRLTTMRYVVSSIVCFALSALPASAITYRHYQHREIVVEADLVVVAKILSIIDPPDAKKDDERPGYSLARVRIERVFKGDVKEGREIFFSFWSQAGTGKYEDKWRHPDAYKLGDTLMLALRKSNERRTDGYRAPQEIARALWYNWSPRYIYGKQIEGDEFRKVAELWLDPEKHLGDPKRVADAAFFLGHQKRLPEKTLLALLQSGDLAKQHAGCLAAGVMKTTAAVPGLVGIIEKLVGITAKWNAAYEDERKKLEQAANLYEQARTALYHTPFDGDKDGPAL